MGCDDEKDYVKG